MFFHTLCTEVAAAIQLQLVYKTPMVYLNQIPNFKDLYDGIVKGVGTER